MFYHKGQPTKLMIGDVLQFNPHRFGIKRGEIYLSNEQGLINFPNPAPQAIDGSRLESHALSFGLLLAILTCSPLQPEFAKKDGNLVYVEFKKADSVPEA